MSEPKGPRGGGEGGRGADGLKGIGASKGDVLAGEEGTLRVRPGRREDRPFVEELARAVFSRYGPYELVLPACLDDGGIQTWIIEVGNRSVGLAMLSAGGGIGEILAVAVAPAFQGRGVGERLMREIILEARRRGLRGLFLRTATGNRAARRLFKKVGFEDTDVRRDYYPLGQSAVGMLMRL